MAIKIALNHITTYRYDSLINLGPQIIRLRPAPHARTPILSYALKIKPQKHFINWQQDPQANYLARLSFPHKTDIFQVEVDLTADMTVINPFDFFLESYAEYFPFKYEPWLIEELKPFLVKEEAYAIFKTYLKSIGQEKKRTVDYLAELIQQLNKEIKYLIRLEPGVQTPEETLDKKSGSCRDSAWLLVNLLRHKGLAARFVSGYLIQLKADVKSLDGPAGTEEDFCELHAWAELYLPGAGWVGLDVTSGLFTGEGHIPLAATPKPSSASPVSGLVDACKVSFHHAMKLTRFYEDPRVTKPYTKEQWEHIQLVGHKVDQELKDGDVRLTMGSEPTFISKDDMESLEWNTTALGAHKRLLAQNLLNNLKKRWTKGALIYSGQGKWYPGEQLPRWVLGCYWRKDGIAIWKDAEWCADETKVYAYTVNDAGRFIKKLSENLGIDQNFVIQGYEDIFYYLWKEKKLPSNVNPLDSKLNEPFERKRLARIFDKGIGKITGFALPLKSMESADCLFWISSPWKFRSSFMFLTPGDSPMGLRLPLDSLLWSNPEDLPQIFERDPLQDVADLKNFSQKKIYSKVDLKRLPQNKAIPQGQLTGDVVRTALCVEERAGCIYVFLPPVGKIEEYLDLITHIEETAAALKMPVVVEGYAPPYDLRVESFQVTPDPGVIEVNVAPVSQWTELVDQTASLYEEAHRARLSTEKFMLDGKHSGTGGGSHFVLGGRTPADSPFLRRPDLLASLIAYWNNHPSLSYLFSGQFIGPTSQAPRLDEGRKDNIYELEIAIKQLDEEITKFGQCPPWLVDRLFRNLLVDGTGNTHRAEFCIDKLYSPDSTRGRLGLVELRAFEMPPCTEMNIAQQLLIRALVVKFWKAPFKFKPIRWGTSLHDRFLLPYFVKEDFKEVLSDLSVSGFDLKMEHFAPHVEFRFPKIGEVRIADFNLELRAAIEPWYVLGEEQSGGGTSRYVDSSVERIQIRVKGASQERYIFCCNGRKIPLHQTQSADEYIAGIRYRAWQPPSCLHPTIGVHSPLTFDIIDTYNKRSIGGCVYHVVHPGGRNYDTFPVNAFEAEARRNSRFSTIGHTHGVIHYLPADELNVDFPMTLDLRTSPLINQV